MDLQAVSRCAAIAVQGWPSLSRPATQTPSLMELTETETFSAPAPMPRAMTMRSYGSPWPPPPSPRRCRCWQWELQDCSVAAPGGMVFSPHLPIRPDWIEQPCSLQDRATRAPSGSHPYGHGVAGQSRFSFPRHGRRSRRSHRFQTIGVRRFRMAWRLGRRWVRDGAPPPTGATAIPAGRARPAVHTRCRHARSDNRGGVDTSGCLPRHRLRK
jgi:hypothetical protein